MSTPEHADTAPADPQRPASLNVSVYLPESLNLRLRQEKARTGLPYTAVLAAAFDQVGSEHLHTWLHHDRTEPIGARSGMPASSSWSRHGGGVQVQLRMSTPQRAWLDEKVTFHRAPSRSALVAAVLDLGLPQS
ncbi:hypothetical protein [Micrococcus luteus]|uniref:hypothetical protein n=1 Tax=Micrococcus luteus TaxID=1270 RepID=UPI002303BD91|nr:hypothetical protein [Micrococcus luteus]